MSSEAAGRRPRTVDRVSMAASEVTSWGRRPGVDRAGLGRRDTWGHRAVKQRVFLMLAIPAQTNVRSDPAGEQRRVPVALRRKERLLLLRAAPCIALVGRDSRIRR